MRRAITPAIPPSMYRHFAVITLVLTLGLAMFADGESRQAREVPMQTSRPRPAPQAHFAASRTHDVEATARAFANDISEDFDNGFGEPMQSMASNLGSSVIPDVSEVTVPGFSQEYLASLSEEERQLLLQGLQENGMLSPEIRGDRSAAIVAASSRRSGRPTQD
jgi:hypothetical protein